MVGLEKALSRLSAYEQKVDDVAGKVIQETGFKIWKEAQGLSPVDTGRMKRSSLLAIPSKTKAEIRFTTHYAVYVHEILTNYHPVGQAKFLEVPFKANQGPFFRKMASELGRLK